MARIEGISRGMVILRYQTIFLECGVRAGIEVLMAELSSELSQSRWNRKEREDEKEGEAELVIDEGSSAQLSSPWSLLLRHQQPLKLRCMKPHHLTATNTKHFTRALLTS
jgi:hypothetical protein